MKYEDIKQKRESYNPRAKSRYMSTILYPENMRKDWQKVIGDILQIPYCYIIHDMDSDEQGEVRKTHVHLIMVFPNTTTLAHGLKVANELRKSASPCAPTIEPVVSIRSAYEYLIHNTENSKSKHQYDRKERISGNGFDIGAYESLTASEKLAITYELAKLIHDKNYTTFGDFVTYVMENCESEYFKIAKDNTNFFKSLTASNWQKKIQNIH